MISFRGTARPAVGIALGACLLHLIGGCAQADSSTGAEVRFANSTASTSLDFYDNTSSKTNALFSSTAANTVSSYSTIDANTYTFAVTGAGSSTTLASTSVTVADFQHYLFVGYGTASALSVVTLAEDDTAPASGYAQVRVLNGAVAAGSVDVYLTSTTAALDSSAAVVTSAGVGTATGFKTVTPGTYRLRVIGTGVTSDVRLDTTFTLADKSIQTMVLTPNGSGTAVNALNVVEGD